MSGPRFHDLLEHALEQRSALDVADRRPVDGRRPRHQPGRSVGRAQPPPTGIRRLPGASLPPAARPANGFWSRLERAQATVGDRDPPPVPLTGVVGPLAATIPTVRRTLSRRRAGDCEVTVLTKRAEIVSEPSWRLVRDGFRLVEAATNRQRPFGLVVIDTGTELAPWVRALVTRLRAAGMGMVRYVVAGDPTDAKLVTGREMLGQPLVVDLVQPAEPARVLELTGRGEPIATVGGTLLTAELVLAMEAEVAGG